METWWCGDTTTIGSRKQPLFVISIHFTHPVGIIILSCPALFWHVLLWHDMIWHVLLWHDIICSFHAGSFWEAPLKLEDNRQLLEKEKNDLLNEMMALPQNAVVRRINELVSSYLIPPPSPLSHYLIEKWVWYIFDVLWCLVVWLISRVSKPVPNLHLPLIDILHHLRIFLHLLHIPSFPCPSSYYFSFQVKRARSVKVHAYIIHYLKKQMPYVIGKAEKQKKLLDRLDREFLACARRYNLPLGDFPPVEQYRKMLREIKDISDFKKLDKNLVYEMDRVLTHDIPLLLQKATMKVSKKRVGVREWESERVRGCFLTDRSVYVVHHIHPYFQK